jgi:hypothetical protein
VVVASLSSVGEGIGGGGLLLCLWAEISMGPWMVHNNVIEKKINLLWEWCLKEERKGNPHLRSQSLLLLAV